MVNARSKPLSECIRGIGKMPVGVMINALSVAVGGMAGAFAGNKLSARLKEDFNMIFGTCFMGMGISAIVLMENMPAVIFGVIIGEKQESLCCSVPAGQGSMVPLFPA